MGSVYGIANIESQVRTSWSALPKRSHGSTVAKRRAARAKNGRKVHTPDRAGLTEATESPQQISCADRKQPRSRACDSSNVERSPWQVLALGAGGEVARQRDRHTVHAAAPVGYERTRRADSTTLNRLQASDKLLLYKRASDA
jgi:hypothetical protein